MLDVYHPALPCGRFPMYCADAENRIRHDAHDWNLPNAAHEGWHCYGSSVTTSGQGVGWAGGTEEPGDAMNACQNNPSDPYEVIEAPKIQPGDTISYTGRAHGPDGNRTVRAIVESIVPATDGTPQLWISLKHTDNMVISIWMPREMKVRRHS